MKNRRCWGGGRPQLGQKDDFFACSFLSRYIVRSREREAEYSPRWVFSSPNKVGGGEEGGLEQGDEWKEPGVTISNTAHPPLWTLALPEAWLGVQGVLAPQGGKK